MCSVTALRIGGGVAFAALAIGLTVITAIALAIIFAPPFLALYSGVAIYLSIGCGIGAAIATIVAAILLSKKPAAHEDPIEKSNSNEPEKLESNEEPSKSEEDPPLIKRNPRDRRIDDYLVVADAKYVTNPGEDVNKTSNSLKSLCQQIITHPKFSEYKERYHLEMDRLDLEKDPYADNIAEIHNNLAAIYMDMQKESRKD